MLARALPEQADPLLSARTPPGRGVDCPGPALSALGHQQAPSPQMNSSLRDFLDFVILWLKKRTGVHQEPQLLIYPALVRHCLCCHSGRPYAEDTDGLCRECRQSPHCPVCDADFEPSMESVGVFCPSCWGDLETTWTTAFGDTGVASAESAIRSRVTAARPVLQGCSHPS